MSRDIEDRLEVMLCGTPAFELRRLALNMDQVEKYDPPPSPAKITDSRAKKYILEYGNNSWELDALNPAQLTQLVEEELLSSLVDLDVWATTEEREQEDQDTIKELIKTLG